MTDMVELAEQTVAHALRVGASQCDVLVVSSRYLSGEIEKGSVKQANTVVDSGVAVRAFKEGCPGFAYCTGFQNKSIREAVELAVSQARAGTPDHDFKGLPEKCRPKSLKGLYEPRIANLGADDVVRMVMDLASVAGDDKRIASVNASVGAGVGEIALANSNGFSGKQKLSSIDVVAEAVARSGTEMFSGYDGDVSRRLQPEVIERIGSSAREHALMGLARTNIQTGDFAVILDPLAAGFIFSAAIGGGVNADSVQRKRSYLADKLGERIGSEGFSVVDDPTIAWGAGSYSFDGEGVPARRKSIVDRGVLKSYIYDSYTAGKDSVRSTGNSSRGGPMWSYRSPPSISMSNLVVRKGDASTDEMIGETKDGVYLRTTFDHPNLVTGEFSGLMMESYRIKRGEIGPSIRQATIGISLLDMFSRIDMVGKEVRTAFSVRIPPVRISKARVAGSG